ncbi:erythromycin resistance leader peptide [Ureibacillus endophyticus]|uniref:Uncharacterized protein n=1 Tax=Ureibacillus endophyticus TaxID=1978490 RepID=A0A494Z2J3_9BACL|nr:hypothetical protein D8M03_09205 [Lysinibacillus endophyticus]
MTHAMRLCFRTLNQ